MTPPFVPLSVSAIGDALVQPAHVAVHELMVLPKPPIKD